MTRILPTCLLALGLAACTPGPASRPPAAARIDAPLVREYVHRSEAITTARAYLEHEWLATARHAFHGVAPDGIRIDTPDRGFGTRGWWQKGGINRGIPYKWGGFDTPLSFDVGLASGKFAGDVYTDQKRRQLDDAVSDYAVGIDCSGFISRCWKLPRSFSTRELPSLSHELQSYEQLRAGDILNVHNEHVLLFERFTSPDHSHMVVYEAGSPPSWKVLMNTTPTAYLQGLGYRPYRYKYIRD